MNSVNKQKVNSVLIPKSFNTTKFASHRTQSQCLKLVSKHDQSIDKTCSPSKRLVLISPIKKRPSIVSSLHLSTTTRNLGEKHYLESIGMQLLEKEFTRDKVEYSSTFNHISSPSKNNEDSFKGSSYDLSSILKKRKPLVRSLSTEKYHDRITYLGDDQIKHYPNTEFSNRAASAERSGSRGNIKQIIFRTPSCGNKALERTGSPIIRYRKKSLELSSNPRQRKISQILSDVKQSMSVKKYYNDEESYVAPLSGERVLEPFYDSPANIRIKTTENLMIRDSQDITFPVKAEEITKQLNEYRALFRTQLVDLNKIKRPIQSPQKQLLTKQNFASKAADARAICRSDAIKKEIKQRFAKTINHILRKLIFMNLSFEDIIIKEIFQSTPYQKVDSRSFLDYVKLGDYSRVLQLLKLDIYHTYDFDQVSKQTALHWAAKRDYTHILKLLLKCKADPDARDINDRTPLFLATKCGHINCIKLLLFHGADPRVRSSAGKFPIDYTNDVLIKGLLLKGIQMHALLSIHSYKKFKQMWSTIEKRDFEVKLQSES